VLLVVLGMADRAGDGVALAQGEPPDLRQRDVDVGLPRQVAGGPQEPVTLGKHVEEAGADRRIGDLALALLHLALAPFLAEAPALLARQSLPPAARPAALSGTALAVAAGPALTPVTAVTAVPTVAPLGLGRSGRGLGGHSPAAVLLG